ncbi:hypothetical protein [Bradyrhizobium ottawaense]|uniref:Uncharacterized protein n=1 Tax=Bradyrhizobium ottawaense TaxID=931866 RepID=A0ABY0QHG4_9BRAD|nr:hypothetical protein [Bradyrhizobium ottawaense]SDK45371.1 hypothetical protein SAMN05444163_8148 [Bradyrhizobium ottawaense]
MDFFKPGSFSILMLNTDGSLTEIDASPDFLTNAAGETQSCDCPPGVCLGEAGNELADDDYNDDDDVIFVEDEGVHPADRLEAVAQLGRITESLASLANLQGRLVSELLEG